VRTHPGARALRPPAIRAYGVVRSEPTALTGRQRTDGRVESLAATWTKAFVDVGVMGTGYVGLVSSETLVGLGNQVIGRDIDEKKTRSASKGDLFVLRARTRRSLIGAIPILLIFTGIVVWSIGPFSTPDLPGVLEGLPHAVAYAVLAWAALNLLMAGSTPRLRARGPRIMFVTLLSAFVGIGLEIAQATVHRDAEVGDVIADVVGITAGVLAWLIADRRRQRSSGAP
jgi:VanZ family protein